MYGMMPSAKTVARDSPPPRVSYRPKNPAAAEFWMKSARAWHVDPGRGDVRADPVDQQRQEREQELALQLRIDRERRGAAAQSLSASTLPPAASILARAEADTVTPRTVKARAASPVPSSLTGRSGSLTSPAACSVAGVTSPPGDRSSGAQVDDLAVDLERIGEAPLRQPPVHRHLAALEARVGLSRRCAPCGPCGPCPTSCRCPSPGRDRSASGAGCEPAAGFRVDRVTRPGRRFLRSATSRLLRPASPRRGGAP